MNEDLYQLPAGWEWVKLGQIGTIVGGGTPKRGNPKFFENGTIPWFTPTDVDLREILRTSKTAEKITVEALNESSARLLPPGTVLFSSRASIGKIAIAAAEVTTNQGFANIIPAPILQPQYLAYGLRHFTKDIERLGSGTTYAEVAKSSLKEFYFPLAPLGEQKRIVAKVESLFAESKTAREALDKVPVLLQRFRQSVLTKAFKGELTQREPGDEPVEKLVEKIEQKRQTKHKEEQKTKCHTLSGENEETESLPVENMSELPDEWTWARMGDVLVALQYGTSEKASGTKAKGTTILRMGNIQDGALDLSSLKYIDLNENEKNKYLLKKGDILINRTNSSELVGKSAIFDLDGDFVFASYLIRLRTDANVVASSFLNFFISSIFGRRYIEQVKHQVAGQANINSKNIREMPIPVPSLSEQKRIVTKVEGLFSPADIIEAAVEKARKSANAIDQAILAKAFRGELVPQNPNDEPASVLLERIKYASQYPKTKANKQKIL